MIRSRRGLLVGFAWLAPLVLAAPSPPSPDVTFALRTEIEGLLRSRVDGHVERLELPSLDSFYVGVPAEDLRIRLSVHPQAPSIGRVPIGVSIESSDGRPLRRGVVTAVVEATKPVVVARRQLRSGDVLGAADVERRSVSLDRLPARTLSNMEGVVGQRLKRSVKQGAPILASALRPVPEVARGEQVKLRLARGALMIEGMGRAKEDGHTGDFVRVVSDSSRKEIVGRVGADGVVYVDF